MEAKEKQNVLKIRCPICNSANVYTTLNKRICRKCGHREELKK